ncbi:hypothetical protein [Achromobacter phage Motura]|uniref:Uncharacterized protein n=1 Tax=Achromobacter phage Motura TaxID=2591403 RepID=A0A514CSN2_9CAUD|nr:hypothetical protein H1O15_gp319 [Achromobacter phage Motura]QDH83487.1 hypothetical protein [Achromobacter phage Motura]
MASQTKIIIGAKMELYDWAADMLRVIAENVAHNVELTLNVRNMGSSDGEFISKLQAQAINAALITRYAFEDEDDPECGIAQRSFFADNGVGCGIYIFSEDGYDTDEWCIGFFGDSDE